MYFWQTKVNEIANKIYDPAEERRELLNRRNSLATTIAQSRSHAAELTKRVGELGKLRIRTLPYYVYKPLRRIP